MRHLLLPRETDAYWEGGWGGGRKRERERERGNDKETEGESAGLANIFPLQGAGAEGPSAVSCNRTSLFVSAQGSLRAINGTQYPLCRELVSVSLETDKHIIHKCQTVCVQCDATGGEQDFGIAAQQSFPCSTLTILMIPQRGRSAGDTSRPVEPAVCITERKSITVAQLGKH